MDPRGKTRDFINLDSYGFIMIYIYIYIYMDLYGSNQQTSENLD